MYEQVLARMDPIQVKRTGRTNRMLIPFCLQPNLTGEYQRFITQSDPTRRRGAAKGPVQQIFALMCTKVADETNEPLTQFVSYLAVASATAFFLVRL